MSMHARVTASALLAIAAIAILAPVADARPAGAQDAPESVALLVQPSPQPQPALPAIDVGSLTLESDFTVFMKSDCPEELRLSALRRLWTLLPQAAPVENSAI